MYSPFLHYRLVSSFEIFNIGSTGNQKVRVVLVTCISSIDFLCLPPTGSGDILFFPVRLSVRLSVRPSVRLSVRHKSCPLNNLKTVKDFSMKLGTLVNHDETMCHAQEP